MHRTAIAVITLAAMLAASFWAGREWRDRSCDLATSRAQTTQARAETTAQADARAVERAGAETMATIGDTHERDRTAAADVETAVADAVRAGTLRLRHDLAACHTQRLSDAAAGTLERDAAAERGAAFAGAVVRVGRDADDQLRSCQAVVASYGRTTLNEKAPH